MNEKIIAEFNNWKLCNSSSFNVKKGFSDNVDITLNNLPYDFFPVNCNYINDISIYIYCNTTFEAPLQAHCAIGYLTVSINTKNVLSLDIYNSNPIPQKHLGDFLNEIIKDYIIHLETLLYKKV